VRKSGFIVRSLKFLKLTIQPLAPPLLLPPLLPLCRAAAPPLATDAAPPKASYCSSPAPHVVPELACRLSPSLLAFPEHATLLCRSTKPPLCRRRLPPLTVAATLPAPPPALVAPTRRLRASRHPSSSSLASFRALHAAPPLPELCSAATSPPSWLAPCIPSSPFFTGLRRSVAFLPPFRSLLHSHFTPNFEIHRRRSSSSPATSLLSVGRPPQLLSIHDSPSSSFAMIP
jgi:hypothetical protein